MNPKQPNFLITAQQLQVLANFLAKLPWEQANPHVQMLNSLRPVELLPEAPQLNSQENPS
jgi:hypothetical protein